MRFQSPETSTFRPAGSENFDNPAWTYTRNDPDNSYDGGGGDNAPYGFGTGNKISEDLFRGHPAVVQRQTTTVAGGSGALQVSLQNEGGTESEFDNLIWSAAGLGYGGNVPVEARPGIKAYVHVADPATYMYGYDADGFYETGLMQVAFDGGTDYYPAMYASREPGDPTDAASWYLRTDDLGYHAVKSITEAGWWTIGMSANETDRSVDYWIAEGIVPAFAPTDYQGSYLAGLVDTLSYTILWGTNADVGGPMGPAFVWDELNFYAIPEPASLSLIGMTAMGLLGRRRRQMA